MSRPLVYWSLAVAAVAAAVWRAASLAWTCDDAFITFRYAQHFVDGHGLVFNLDPSEAPVEGYTNFSWTIWMALGAALGFGGEAMASWSIFWGVVCHAGVVLLLGVMGWRASHGRALVPVAACGYVAVHHAASLAPAGLETALFVLLVTSMARLAMSTPCARKAWMFGFLGVLCALTRPDGGIFVAMGGLFVLYDAWRRRAPRLLMGYVLPFVLVFLPYLLWRYAFYGAWVPNTAVAKSASEPFLGYGARYVVDFFCCYWALLPGVVPVAWFLLRRPDPMVGVTPFVGRRPWLVWLAFVVPYLAFVVWVGGDFMFSRFLLPVLPVMLFGWDLALLRWRAPWLQAAVAALLVAGLSARVEPDGLGDPRNAVSDNRRITVANYPGTELTWAEAFRMCGQYLQPLFEGLDVRIAIAGGHANLAFRTQAPVAVEVAAGLTDAHIARLPYVQRSKAGHGKPSDPEYLEARGVHFHLEPTYGRDDAWRSCFFTAINLPVQLVTWDAALMAELRRREPNIQLVDFEDYLDGYLASIGGKSKEQVATDLRKFRRFYFDHNEDPARLARFESFLR
ncbi:MAG: hypothetical protein VYA51_09435 [Planctomycetota bacterium]|nr:hypothetical protein [Planctomycetota bacterium]